MSGRVVHFEIPYDDRDRATGFYREAFGWNLQAMPGAGYTLVTSGPTGRSGPTEPGFINGGVMSRAARPPPAPGPGVDVGSIEDTLPPAEAPGGRAAPRRGARCRKGLPAP